MINRLESLELQGFKTFSNQVRLEFPGQITAIVGPNGSGKSNIADSIRWVLGEQSYSLLRARRTEDMIFSGSQQKPRSGMASSTITFNNQDGWLPIDFAEVSICRRAYRDGQNEYLLNGQKVRLKDITELLSQTGLAEMSYTIIGQGLVDVALALKPDERKQLFEEAAGIGLYRSRKEEALRRLENTRKNLDRVLDIISEIRPRLRSLEKQSARYVEFEQVKADLRVLLRDWYGFHWHNRQEHLLKIRTAYQEQDDRLNELRRQFSCKQTSVEKVRESLRTKRQALETAYKQLSDFHLKLEEANRKLAILDERQRVSLQQKGQLEIDLGNVQELVLELSSRAESYQEEIAQKKADSLTAKEEYNAALEKLHEITENREQSENALENLRQKRILQEMEVVQVGAHLQELINRRDNLAVEEQKIVGALEELVTEADARQALVDSLSRTLGEFDSQIRTLEEELAEQKGLVQEKRDHHEALVQKGTMLETERMRLSGQLDLLEQADAALSGYSKGSKALLEEAQKGRLPGGIEPLSKHIVVSEDYERAISAALGELTDVLIVPTGGQELILEFLESEESDRVALLEQAESKATRGHHQSFSQQEGVIGIASQLVEAEEAFRNLVELLLDDILVVSDIKTAKRIQPGLSGRQKAVTLSGMVFHADGVIISGQNATSKRIGRTRQKTELKQELSLNEQRSSSLRNELEQSDRSIKDAEEQQNRLLQSHERLLEDQKSIRRDLEAAENSLQRVTQQKGWHTSRQSEISQLVADTSTQIQAEEVRLQAIQERVTALLTDERQAQGKLKEMSIFEAQQRVNQWQTHLAVAESALTTALQRLTEHEKRMHETQDRAALYADRLASLTSGLTQTHAEDSALKESIAAISTSIKTENENVVDPLLASIAELESLLATDQKVEESIRQQVTIAERHHTQLQLELGRASDQLQNLQQRIEDDFGLVAYDYDNQIGGHKPLPFEDGSIENLPPVKEIGDSLEDDIKRLKMQLRRIGSVNPEAQEEYYNVRERHEFLSKQTEDLEKASADLHEVIQELDVLMERDFLKTFKAVNEAFSVYFSRLFNGGEGKLLFSDETNPVDGGVDIEARLPGRRSQSLALLSGGERSLTAVALIFALLKVSPTPFCILDEVDAMLDESNVGRFAELLKELAEKTQFVIITHNRNTVQAADVIYGVTMGRDSTSQMISLKLEDVTETYLQ